MFVMKSAFIAFAAAALFSAASFAADRPAMVIQVSEANPATWNMALNNARNLQAEFGKDGVDLEIVAFGPGVRMLEAHAEIADRVTATVDAGIKVTACENTLRAFKLERADMNDKIGYVPAGVAQILRLQQKGWAYLRP
jgi:intracellular sulfur oxidation DsrE/DsrF family protein